MGLRDPAVCLGTMSSKRVACGGRGGVCERRLRFEDNELRPGHKT